MREAGMASLIDILDYTYKISHTKKLSLTTHTSIIISPEKQRSL